MTETERKKRQERAKARRRKEVMRQRMILGVIILVIIIIIVAVAVPKKGSSKKSSKKNQEVKTEAVITPLPNSSVGSSLARPDENASAVTDANTSDQTAAVSGETTVGQPNSSSASNLRNADVAAADTSSFAVMPGVPCGAPMTDEKIVYLTLDDGPSYLTAQFLDVLDRYNVKATFFVTAQNPDYFPLIAEAARRGHTIGLHTFSHDYATVYSSVDNYFYDLAQIGSIVQQQIGYVPCFIRFPGGSCNYISHDYCPGIMTALSELVQQQGYQYFDWNCSSGDGATVDDPNLLVAAATNNIFDTVVLLSHDGNGKETTLEALPQIIEHYLSEGYEFRPITREAYTSHQTIEN